MPGRAFYADGTGQRFLRLSYCFPTAERITEGVRRLAGVVRDELEVVQMFGPTAPRAGRPAVDGPGPELA